MGWTRGYFRGVPCGVCHEKRSGVRCRDLPEDRRTARYPSQEVEQDRGHYYGLPGSDGAAWNPSQEVEQGRGVIEPRGICHREWSRIATVTAARQGAKVCRLKSGWSVWQREVVSHLSKRSSESGFRKSSDGVFLQSQPGVESGSCRGLGGAHRQLKSRTRPGSRRSPSGVFLQLKSDAKFGSRRSPDGAYQQLELVTEPGSRRSPGGLPCG